MEADALIPVTRYGVNVVTVGPDGGREFEARVRLRRRFHRLVESRVHRDGETDGVHFGSILTDPHHVRKMDEISG